MTDGFLGRWSRRKLDATEDKPPPAGPPVVMAAEESEVEPAAASTKRGLARPPTAVQPPTLEDVRSLTPESDFSRFAARGVTPDIRNAAMKKLFADPRSNVMDGLDVYIGDYSKPDPVPHAVLRKLASARFLGLFDQEEREEAEAARRAGDVADNPEGQSVTQSDSLPAIPEPNHHDDPDLRLQ